MAPRKAVSSAERPPNATQINTSVERVKPISGGETKPNWLANSAPAKPATAAERVNTESFRARVSWPRKAVRVSSAPSARSTTPRRERTRDSSSA
jgi:hypothetical protein